MVATVAERRRRVADEGDDRRAPRARQYSIAATLSLVVPDSEGMTTIDPFPIWREPPITSSAASGAKAGKADLA